MSVRDVTGLVAVDGGRSVQAESCIWGKEDRDGLSANCFATLSLYHQTSNKNAEGLVTTHCSTTLAIQYRKCLRVGST